ncbi:MAG: intermembrane phospholipid transport protein YdbH family protein, partial [Hyphomonas sp.]
MAVSGWSGLFAPEVRGVTVNGLSLRGRLDREGLRFGGLERLVQAGDGGRAAPPVEIRDARLLLETPAGLVRATLNVSGSLPRNGTLSLRLDPGELGLLAQRADLSEARLDVRAVDGRLDAELALGLNHAAFLDYGLEDFALLVRTGFDLDQSQPAALEWSLRASGIAAPGVGVADLRSSGRAEFDLRPEPGLETARQALAGAVFEAEAENASWRGYSAGITRIEGELSGRKGEVSGPLVLTAANVVGEAGSVSEIALVGELLQRRSSRGVFDGKVSVTGASLNPALRRSIGSAFSLPGVLQGHGEGLRTALEDALTDFGAHGEVRIGADGKDFGLEAAGAAQFLAASGLSVRMLPGEGLPWLRSGAGHLSVSGDVLVSGGGAPSTGLDIRTLSLGGDVMRFDAAAFRLDPWIVAGRSLAGDLRDLRLEGQPGKLILSASGQVSFAGEAAGVHFGRLTVTGGVDAVRDAAGWRAQPAGAPCLGVDAAGMRIAAISLERAHVDVCPVNGRFIRQGPVPAGSADLGNLNLPFRMGTGSGEVILDGAAIDWTAGKGLLMTLRGASLNVPLTMDERTLTIVGADPRIDLQTGTGPSRIAARLGVVILGGTMIPANVSARAISFDGIGSASGVEGRLTGSGVLVTDRRADPLYEPVSADFTGTLSDTRLVLAAPVLLRKTGGEIADAAADLDIIRLDGSASLVSRPLTFRPGGLQPDMISDRLTGLFTDASGSLSAEARFTIKGGEIAGTADVRIRDFGFQTNRLGRVTGINGDIAFADLIDLRTAPDQLLTLGSLNPGIALESGRIVFDLDGGVLHLDSATFPFAGGTLAAAAFDWTLEGGLQDQLVAVTADAVDLGRLVEIIKLPDTRATGTVSGTLPILFTQNRVEIRQARLTADEPGGRLSYTGGVAGAASGQDARAGLAFDALRDLRFRVLEVGINGDLAGQMRADLLLAGENVNPLPMGDNLTLPAGQAFEFAIGFDVPLGKLLEQNLGLVTQQDVIDATLDLINAQGAEQPVTRAPPE